MNACRFLHSVFLFAVFSCCTVFAADPPAAIAWHGRIDVATGGGERGPWQQNRSRYDYVDDATVAIDGRGEIGMAWVDQGRKTVLFQRYAAAAGARLSPQLRPRFERPVAVSRSPQVFSWLPRLAFAPDSRWIYVLWQDIIFSGGSHGGDIMFARSEDGGASFSEPINLSDSVSGAGKGRITRENWHNGSYDLAVGADGAVYVAWTEFEGRLLFARSSDGGISFSRAQPLTGDDARPARGPTLAAGANNNIYLAWTVGEQRTADIHVVRSTNGGESFGQPQIAARTGTYSDAPKLALDGNGVLHLAYAESAAGPFDRFRVHYTRSTDGARTFEAPREISTPVPGGAISAHFPHLALDSAGNPVVVWELQAQRQARPRGLGIALSRDGGRSFSTPALVPHSVDPAGGYNGSHQGLLMEKLAVNAGGLIAIANSSLRESEGSRVWLVLGHLL